MDTASFPVISVMIVVFPSLSHLAKNGYYSPAMELVVSCCPGIGWPASINRQGRMMSYQSLLRRRYYLPGEHGAWIWWIGPYLIGIAAARQWTTQLITLFIAMMAAFLIRQPLTILVKTLSNRRAKEDRLPAIFWVCVYALVVLAAFAMLLLAGFGRLIWLLLPGIPVFIWHLYLVSRRAERGQRGIEIVGAGVLALAAPASYWVAGGTSTTLAWALWGITWLQSAASIVLVYQRLHERKLDAGGSFPERFRRSSRSLAYHSFNLIINLLAIPVTDFPWLVPAASTLMLLDAADAVRSPAIHWKPTRIGLRQLIASSLFILMVATGFFFVG
jgi:hypothetical protein